MDPGDALPAARRPVSRPASEGAADVLPVIAFADRAELRRWSTEDHRTSPGVLVRMQEKRSPVPCVSFEDVLDEGLCSGWSESKRLPVDADSYLQQFTPRRTRGTTSRRNLAHAQRLIEQGPMTPAGLAALGLDDDVSTHP